MSKPKINYPRGLFRLLKAPYRVKNVSGTGNETCGCGSWLNHWRKYSGLPEPEQCSALGCNNTDLVGAHVKIAICLFGVTYIVPLCQEHNMKKITFLLKSDTEFVNAYMPKCAVR